MAILLCDGIRRANSLHLLPWKINLSLVSKFIPNYRIEEFLEIQEGVSKWRFALPIFSICNHYVGLKGQQEHSPGQRPGFLCMEQLSP